MIEDIAIYCFRFLSFKRFDEVLDLDFREFRLLSKANQIRQVDEQLHIHQLAYATMKAGLRDKNGKLIYKKFDSFFDYKKEIKKVTQKKEKSISDTRLNGYKEFLKKKEGGKP